MTVEGFFYKARRFKNTTGWKISGGDVELLFFFEREIVILTAGIIVGFVDHRCGS